MLLIFYYYVLLIVPLKDKKGITITNVFQKLLYKSNCKPNKVWIDKGNEFHNRSIKSGLQDNNIALSSTHNERNCVVAERFTRTLKNKIWKYMTSVSKNVYINKLHDIVNKYNNAYHRTIEINLSI